MFQVRNIEGREKNLEHVHSDTIRDAEKEKRGKLLYQRSCKMVKFYWSMKSNWFFAYCEILQYFTWSTAVLMYNFTFWTQSAV